MSQLDATLVKCYSAAFAVYEAVRGFFWLWWAVVNGRGNTKREKKTLKFSPLVSDNETKRSRNSFATEIYTYHRLSSSLEDVLENSKIYFVVDTLVASI